MESNTFLWTFYIKWGPRDLHQLLRNFSQRLIRINSKFLHITQHAYKTFKLVRKKNLRFNNFCRFLT